MLDALVAFFVGAVVVAGGIALVALYLAMLAVAVLFVYVLFGIFFWLLSLGSNDF